MNFDLELPKIDCIDCAYNVFIKKLRHYIETMQFFTLSMAHCVSAVFHGKLF